MDNHLTHIEIRERILSTFDRSRRWMGFYLVRSEADLAYSSLPDYCDAFVSLVIRGTLIETGDVSAKGFWQYIPATLLPSANQLAERTEPAPGEGFPSCYTDDRPVGRDGWVCRQPPTPRQLAKQSRSRKGGIESWHVRSAN